MRILFVKQNRTCEPQIDFRRVVYGFNSKLRPVRGCAARVSVDTCAWVFASR
mgnify:CR=1 FL=1